MRIERVVLEHHRDIARLRRHIVYHAVANLDRTGADRLQSGDHSQSRALATPRRPDEHDELGILHIEIDAIDRYLLDAFMVNFTNTTERYAGHCCAPGIPPSFALLMIRSIRSIRHFPEHPCFRIPRSIRN